jgi:uncharacterized protein
MDNMHLMGFIASLLIGVSLGLIGGGGSILTMPVLVYLFGVSPVAATSYSLFVVGSTSLVGAAQQYREGSLNVRVALLFAATSVITVFLVRQWLMTLIPAHIVTIQGFIITKDWLTMILFALLMIASSVFMMYDKPVSAFPGTATRKERFGKIFIFGAGIGLVTGLLGAGGGFLLIPALVLLLHLPMKEAIGTSLFVIALNSLIGFTGNLPNKEMDWPLLLIITFLAIAGILLGNYINHKIPSDKLKKGFGWFVLLMGIYIMVKELGSAIAK